MGRLDEQARPVGEVLLEAKDVLVRDAMQVVRPCRA